ncbi:MAG: DNA primase [Flavobacteriales bacterium]|nr:DNA primase [Flavobacteriales bacterium]
MKKIIKDYSTVSKEQMDLILDRFPDGFDEDDLIRLKLQNGDEVTCLELKTEDAIYLFKISERFLDKIIDYSGDDTWVDVDDVMDDINDDNDSDDDDNYDDD